MHLSAIVAMAENRVIGRNNRLPWRLPADMRYFKKITMGKPILMGRKTYESIGRVLPGRLNIIMTRNTNFQVPEARVVHSLDAALQVVSEVEEAMVIGGAELYQALLLQIQRIYMTVVHAEIEGDQYFPMLDPKEWRQISSEAHQADAENVYAYSFVEWERYS